MKVGTAMVASAAAGWLGCVLSNFFLTTAIGALAATLAGLVAALIFGFIGNLAYNHYKEATNGHLKGA